jgi:hypothetical protein
MADFSKIRRKQTSWPGFFSSTTPVRALPSAHLDEDAEVYQRVKHLQHLRAVQDALDETDVHNTRPGYNPQLDDLLGDPLADRSRFTDVFGRELGLGQTLDELRDEYGPSHVPGEHNEDPGGPRDSWRLGMARDDSSEEEYEDKWVGAFDSATAVLQNLVDYCTALKRQEEAATELSAKLWKNGATWAYNALQKMEAQREENRKNIKYCEELTEQAKDQFRWRFNVNPPIKKPRPDDGGTPPPTSRDSLEIRKAVAELQQLGDPSTDFKLHQPDRRHLTAEAVEALWHFRHGGNPAMYDRLGNLERQRRRMTDQELREILYQVRINNPAINWGDEGPTPPPREGRTRVGHRAPTAFRLSRLDDDD